MNRVTNEPELSVGGLCVATALVLRWNKESLYIFLGWIQIVIRLARPDSDRQRLGHWIA